MDEASQGLACRWVGATWDPMQTWHEPKDKRDRRLLGGRASGRVMRHPALDPIVYARVPDVTSNFDFAPVRRARTITTRTLGGTIVTRFLEDEWDVVVEETWQARDLATQTAMYRQFQKYLMTPLPTGRYVGWTPGDLSPYGYFIELLDVSLGGEPDRHVVDRLGAKRPHMIARDLTVRFKMAFEARGAAGVATMIGD